MDHLLARKKQKKITTTIDEDDYLYVKKHGLKFAHFIRAGVRDHRVHTNDPDAEESMRDLRKSRDRIIEHRNKLLGALRDKLGEEEFAEFVTNI